MGSDFGIEQFKLLQFHFHWGWNDYQGSEHQINFVKYSAEVIPIYLICILFCSREKARGKYFRMFEN
jgi:hypothetical protein